MITFIYDLNVLIITISLILGHTKNKKKELLRVKATK